MGELLDVEEKVVSTLGVGRLARVAVVMSTTEHCEPWVAATRGGGRNWRLGIGRGAECGIQGER